MKPLTKKEIAKTDFIFLPSFGSGQYRVAFRDLKTMKFTRLAGSKRLT
jgi:hypothetical protein